MTHGNIKVKGVVKMNGKKLAQLRKNNKMTQNDFCAIFEVSQPTLSLWENEEREPEPKMIKKIATYFHVSIDYLLDNEKAIKENDLTKLERTLKKEDKERLMTVIKAMFPNEYAKIKDTD